MTSYSNRSWRKPVTTKTTNEKIKHFKSDLKTPQKQTLGDIDVEITDYLIEVKTSLPGDTSQLVKYTDPTSKYFLNFEGKSVILYVEKPVEVSSSKYIQLRIKLDRITEQSGINIEIVNGKDELVKYLNGGE